jgi:putative flippase GtrA
VGFLNTGIDLLVFNSFIAISGIERGNEIVLFKAVSFGTALINSYLWNKFWSFRAGSTGPGRGEFVKYALVTIAGFGINVGTTFALINLIHPPFGLSQLRWDNTAAVIATAANLVWNFIGYRLMVFKAQPAESEVRLQNQHV